MRLVQAIATCAYLLLHFQAIGSIKSDSITFYLLRGIGRESGHWGTRVPDAIRAKIPQARFVFMDLPGAGRYHDKSALPTVEKMADFLRSQHQPYLDSISSRKVILATSLAGNVALEWINTYPTDFHGAVLICSSLKGICKNKERVRPEAKKDFVDIFLMDDIEKRERAFLSINSNLNTENDSLLTSWVALQSQHPVSKGALLKQTVAGMVYKPAKSVPSARVLVVGSQADKIVNPTCLQKVSKTLDSELYLHSTAGHGLPIDAPDWLADTVSYWVTASVMPFNFGEALESQTVETRTDENGMIPMPFVNKSTKAVGKASTEAWEATKSSWQWAGDGVDWIGGFMSEVKVKDKEQKRQLKQAKKDLQHAEKTGG